MPRKKKSGEMSQLIGMLRAMMTQPAGQSKAPKNKPRRKRKRKAAALTQTDPGGMLISRKELVMEVKLAANAADTYSKFDIRPDSFSFLKGISKSFERFRFNKCRIYWKPAVGTTYGGMVAIGMDWDFSDSASQTRADITSYTPSQAFAVWSDTESTPMVLPPNRLQTRAWYLTSGTTFDGGVGRLKLAASGEAVPAGKTLGEIWVDYSVQFSGTQP